MGSFSRLVLQRSHSMSSLSGNFETISDFLGKCYGYLLHCTEHFLKIFFLKKISRHMMHFQFSLMFWNMAPQKTMLYNKVCFSAEQYKSLPVEHLKIQYSLLANAGWKYFLCNVNIHKILPELQFFYKKDTANFVAVLNTLPCSRCVLHRRKCTFFSERNVRNMPKF